MSLSEETFQRQEALNEQFAALFEERRIHDMRCFLLKNGRVIHVDIFEPGCLLVEYAFSVVTAEKYMLEDGDRFYMDELDKNQMFEAMLKEVREVETEDETLYDITDFYAGDYVRVICKDGKIFTGEIEAIEFEATISKEDYVGLYTEDRVHMGFNADEIETIEIIKR